MLKGYFGCKSRKCAQWSKRNVLPSKSIILIFSEFKSYIWLMLLDSLERLIIVWFKGIIIIYRKRIFAKHNFFYNSKKESRRFQFFFLSFPSRSDNGAINSIKRKLHISHTYTQSGRSSYSDHRLCTPVAQSSRTITTQMRAVAVVGLWHISNIYFSVSWFEKPCTKW